MLNLAPLLSQLTIQTKDLTTERFDLSGPFAWAQREFLGEIERQYNAGKPVRIIVLKARQLGISTATEAVLFWWAFLHPGTSGLVIAHENDSSQSLFEKTKLYWESWPYKELYEERYSSQKRLTWEPIKSTLRVATAGNIKSGRGRTIHAMHASECAFYGNPEQLFTGLNQTIPRKHQSLVVLESTANGLGNWFSNTWDAAEAGESDYVPMFFPWWLHYEYRLRTTLCVKSELTAEERQLLLVMRRDGKGMSEETMYQALEWRRWAIPNLVDYDEDMFMQEYPATPAEAFISTGRNVFSLPKIEECYFPLNGHRGTLTEDARGRVVWTPDPAGKLTVYKRPTSARRQSLYFCAGDPTKTVAGDPACVQIINRQTMEQVAVWHGHTDPIHLAKEMILIGKWYHNAELCPEIEGGGQATIATLLNQSYPYIFMHRWADKAPGQPSTSYGWSSNFQRKNWAIGRLKYLLNVSGTIIHDRETYNQLRNYVVLDNGDMGNAGKSGHDDAVMAYAIAVTASQLEGPLAVDGPQPQPHEIYPTLESV